jgi:2',3'-cyclic-nucleotide 2'-phosphodiesterase (5'-nucleotidase family)
MLLLAAWAGQWSAAALSAAVPPPAEPNLPEGAIRVVLLHVNDPHGRLESWTKDGNSVGGYARVATLVGDIRAESGPKRVFLIHAGDEVSKGDELTAKTAGEVNLAILNHLKFDLWTPGNGEFYDGLRAIQARIQQLRFPTLTANVIVKSSGQRLAHPFIIEKAGDVRIAFVGLCSLRVNLPSAWPFKVEDPIETAKKFVPQLRKDSDVIVLVTHIGYEQDVALAKAVGGIDVIIGGHSHTVLEKGEAVKGPDGRDVLVCQAGEFLQYLGRVDLALVSAVPAKGQEGKFRVVKAAARLIAIDQGVKLDPEVTVIIAKASGTTTMPATATAPSQPVGAR